MFVSEKSNERRSAMTDLHPVGSNQSAGNNHNKKKDQSAELQQDWTIKSLPAETVQVTREAAKRSGMKINAWVSRALADAACDSINGNFSQLTLRPESIENHILEEITKLREQNEALKQTIDSMSTILLKLCADRL
jgi:hypothetical protein